MKKYASLLAVFIIALTAYWSFRDQMPNSANVAIKSEFSIQNARAHVQAISQKPHYVGTEEHEKVRNYIMAALKKLEIPVEVQTQTVVNEKWAAGTTVQNIIGRIKGTENKKALMLLSHYDSSPHSALGASDAGSGVAVILEGIRAFLLTNKKPKNDIIILISDAEELDLLGAKAFVNHHPWSKDVGLVLNFEARGSGGPSYMLLETNGKNSKLISEFLRANPTYPVANSLMYSIYKKLPNDTDLTIFREDGNINGFNFAFIGDHFDYHTVQDSYERLDRETLAHQADYLMNTLHYFSNIDLSNLNSDRDYVYVNFPFLKLILFPFSRVIPLVMIATILFSILLFFGFFLNRLELKEVLKGFAAFTISIIVCGGLSLLLWKAFLFIHPQYEDILHGFTYNGYTYIAAFSFLTIWLLYVIYKKFITAGNMMNLFIAPVTFWLILNFLILEEFKGAAFLIIPVYIALLILAIFIFINSKKKNTLLFAVLSIPTIYIVVPMIKSFPVGLGLKNVFISGVVICLLFGLLLPVLVSEKTRKGLSKISFILMLFLFIKASFNTGFSEENKKPNSLVYIKNIDSNTAYWGSYNKTLDAYTKPFFENTPDATQIPDADTKSKYNTPFNYYAAAENKDIPAAAIHITKDTVIENNRYINFVVHPQRKLHKVVFMINDTFRFNSLSVNNAAVNNGKSFAQEPGTFLTYYLSGVDKHIKVAMSFEKSTLPEIIMEEVSNDLLTNSLFDITPRTKEMMPMPFVTNDAIICMQTLKF